MRRFDVAIVGSGFAGSILARCLSRLGLSVVLLERSRHPRFALGESSTPLGSLALERLASRWAMPDLRALATWGRWRREHAELGCGLKRGFTFFAHREGEPFRPDPENRSRLLVAASPNDDVADVHWKRSDVDAHLARQAAAEGVALLEGVEVEEVDRGEGRFELTVRREGGSDRLQAAAVIDGSGAGGVLARSFSLQAVPVAVRSSLVYTHLVDVPDFASVLAGVGPPASRGPYPDDRAAVHHLFDGGWIYLLPFDDGVVSAGAIRVHEPGESAARDESDRAPEEEWEELLARFPILSEQLAAAHPLFSWRRIDRMQRRLERAGGRGWALLPHSFAFFDPIFSTGIAWSLLAVERLAEAFADATAEGRLDVDRLDSSLGRYAELLNLEAARLEQLARGSYLSLGEFDAFVEWSYLYFAWVSFEETMQRLAGADDAESCWRGFLGAGTGEAERAWAGALQRLEGLQGGGETEHEALGDLRGFIADAIEPRNVAGLADPSRKRLYPVDLDLLVERAALVGLTPAEMRRRLPDLLRA